MPNDSSSTRKSRRTIHKYPAQIGTRGRKTGVTLTREVRKDQDGFDNIDDFFDAADIPEGTLPTVKKLRSRPTSDATPPSPSRQIGTRGRKTGVTLTREVRKDQDGFDNIDDFFDAADIPEGTPPTVKKLRSQAQQHSVLQEELHDEFTQIKPDTTITEEVSMEITQDTSRISTQIQIQPDTTITEEVSMEIIQDTSRISTQIQDSLVSVQDNSVQDVSMQLFITDDDNENDDEHYETSNKPFDLRISQDNRESGESDEEKEEAETLPKNKANRTANDAREDTCASEQSALELRRSDRQRIPPLKFWKLERYVYGRPDPGQQVHVPLVKDIIRFSDDDNQSDNGTKRKWGTSDRKPRQNAPDMEMKETNGETEVLEWGTDGEEVTKTVVVMPSMIKPTKVGNVEYKFQKTFTEGDFFTSGIVALPKGSEKPSKNVKDSLMVFYVIKGPVMVTIHKSKFKVSTGGQFCIPRGNQYRIVNESPSEARLFFTQAREVTQII